MGKCRYLLYSLQLPQGKPFLMRQECDLCVDLKSLVGGPLSVRLTKMNAMSLDSVHESQELG